MTFKAFFDRHPEFMEVLFDGCAVGMKSKDNHPTRKPWKLMTTSNRVKIYFENMKCSHHPSEHAQAAGSETARTAFYLKEMTELIIRALYLPRVHVHAAAMPCIHPVSTTHEHPGIEQHLRHVSALSGFEDLAAAVESDTQAHNMVSELLDLKALLGNSISTDSKEVHVMVTKLLSRAEMLSDPGALQAIRDEAEGLVTAGTWDLDSVQEYQSVKDQAKKSGVSVHFGQLMTIASIKFYESTSSHNISRRCRVGLSTVVSVRRTRMELPPFTKNYIGANPTSVQGLNACLAYGALPGNKTTAADAYMCRRSLNRSIKRGLSSHLSYVPSGGHKSLSSQ